MKTSIPLCFYPLQKILIDDDRDFAQSILLKMHGCNFITFDSPRKALDYLLNEYKPSFTKTDLITVNNAADNSSTQQSLSINIKKLKTMLQTKLQKDISVLLIDYHMPEMYGVDLLSEITELPLKKALITGEEDYSIATDAFNKGLVDIYIRKNDSNFLEKIQSAVFDLEWKYFTDLSDIITSIPNNNFNYLKNINFISIFSRYIQENNIVAFCLVDMLGNFLMLDKKGKKKYLLVRSLEQLHELSLIAKEDGGSANTISSLESGAFIPFFNEREFWEIPGKDWDIYLHPAKPVSNEPSLVWTAINT